VAEEVVSWVEERLRGQKNEAGDNPHQWRGRTVLGPDPSHEEFQMGEQSPLVFGKSRGYEGGHD